MKNEFSKLTKRALSVLITTKKKKNSYKCLALRHPLVYIPILRPNNTPFPLIKWRRKKPETQILFRKMQKKVNPKLNYPTAFLFTQRPIHSFKISFFSFLFYYFTLGILATSDISKSLRVRLRSCYVIVYRKKIYLMD